MCLTINLKFVESEFLGLLLARSRLGHFLADSQKSANRDIKPPLARVRDLLFKGDGFYVSLPRLPPIETLHLSNSDITYLRTRLFWSTGNRATRGPSA